MISDTRPFVIKCAAALAAALAFASAPALQAQQENGYTDSQLRNMYTSFLKDRGHTPKVDSDGDVVFQAKGKTHFITVNAKDPNFFRLVFPNFWKIERDGRQEALLAASAASMKTKGAKVFVVDGNVWASVEVFLGQPEDFEAVFDRSMSALRAGVENFIEKMDK